MAEDNNKKSALEELNEQFRKLQESQVSEPKQTTKKVSTPKSVSTSVPKAAKKAIGKASKRRMLIIGGSVIVVATFIFFGVTKGVGSSAAVRKYSSVLSKAEKKSWREMEKQPDELFIEVNTKIPVDADTSQATLHLSNPPYSMFDLEIEVFLKDGTGETLYQSKRIKPATVIETDKLIQTLEAGTYPVTIRFQFYKGKESAGNHDVAAELVVKDNKK